MVRLWHLLVILLFAGVATAQAETDKARLRALQDQGLAAYKAGKFDECAESFAAALAIRPHHPRLLYNLAACSAKAGRVSDAVRALGEYAAMGLFADVEEDGDFDSLEGDAAFKTVLAKFRANRAPLGTSFVRATLSGEPFLAEGIAYDPASRRFFVSSVDQRRIVQVSDTGATSAFLAGGRDGLLGAFGMAIDAERRLLWVASSGTEHVRDLKPSERGAAGLFAFSLADGHLVLSHVLVPPKHTKFVIGDVGVFPDGVYATDSISPKIYFAAAPSPAIRSAIAAREKPLIWLENDAFGSLQGVAATPAGEHLIVADYAAGLHFIARRTKTFTTLGFAGGTTLLGIDGLYRRGNTLLAIQNGVNPQRLLALTLDASGTGVADVRVVSANDPNIPEPSLGTIAGDEFCVVANAQWSRFNDDGTRKQALDPPRIACVAIPK
jgi:hypothetical protein